MKPFPFDDDDYLLPTEPTEATSAPRPLGDEDDPITQMPPMRYPRKRVWRWGNPLAFIGKVRWPRSWRPSFRRPRPTTGSLPPAPAPNKGFDWGTLFKSLVPRLIGVIIGFTALTNILGLRDANFGWWSGDFWWSLAWSLVLVVCVGLAGPRRPPRWLKILTHCVVWPTLLCIVSLAIGWPFGRNLSLAFTLLPLALSLPLLRMALSAGWDVKVPPRYFWTGARQFLVTGLLAWGLIFVPGLISQSGISMPFGLPRIGQNVTQNQPSPTQQVPSSNVPNGTDQPTGGKEASDLASALQGAQNYAIGHDFGKCSDRGLSGVVGYYLYAHGVSDDEMRSDAMKDAFRKAGLNYPVAYSAYYAYSGLGGEFSGQAYSSFNHCING